MTALSFRAVSTVDYHTGGEPFRIVAAPPVDLPGSTVAERRVRAIQNPQADGLRKLLCLEPRGHADMYGGFITPPDDTGADFVSIASYLLAQDVEVATSRGMVRVDIGFGGAIYAQLRADRVGLAVVPEQVNELLAIGREIKWLLNDSPHAQHPSDDRLGGIYGTIVFDELGTTEDGSLHQRNVTIFADGEVDRSPCGSGSASRLAVLAARGDLGPGQTLVHDSIVGSTFRCRVIDSLTADGHPAVIPQITGMAYRCGTSEFTVDPRDPFVAGFVLR
jgi:proline racemase